MEEEKGYKYTTGGIVDTDGLTWVDQNNYFEEVILNKEQVAEFYKLIDKMAELKIDLNNSTM